MSRISKIFISVFIVFNFMCMARVHFPMDTKFFTTVYKPVDHYLRFFSIFQDWLMFAPNPNRTNVEISATIEFEDGTKDVYRFPRSYELGIIGKYMYGEKYRKFTSEGLSRDSNRFMWKDSAMFALRKMGESHYDKMPKTVHLYRHWEDIPLLSESFRTHGTGPETMQSYKFYTHEVLK